MNVLSLFDGMSCGQIALERVGIKIDNYFASEIDKFAIKVTQENYPNTKQLGSVLDLNTESLPKIDLLYGGSPCQSFSRSGDGSGFDGKSKLFWEFVRVFKETKPKYFLLENVVMKKEWEDVITKELGVKPIKIDSKLVSAQKRQRLYWTNIPNIEQPIDKEIKLTDIIIPTDREEYVDNDLIIKKDKDGIHVRNATKKGFLIAEDGDGVNLDFPKSKTRRGRVSKGKTNTLNTSCNYGFVKGNSIYKFNITELERLQTVPDGYTKSVSENQGKRMLGNGWTVDVIAHIFKSIKK
jgi:DNA-cytosine methyltransferase